MRVAVALVAAVVVVAAVTTGVLTLASLYAALADHKLFDDRPLSEGERGSAGLYAALVPGSWLVLALASGDYP